MRKHEIRVRDGITSAGSKGLLRHGNAGSPFDRLNRGFRSCEADSVLIEIVQPVTYFGRRVPCRAGGHKNELDLICEARR